MQIQQDEELKLIVAAMEGLIGIVVFNARDNMWEIYTEKTFLRSQTAPSYDKNVFYYHYNGIHYSLLSRKLEDPPDISMMVDSTSNVCNSKLFDINDNADNDSTCDVDKKQNGCLDIHAQPFISKSSALTIITTQKIQT